MWLSSRTWPTWRVSPSAPRPNTSIILTVLQSPRSQVAAVVKELNFKPNSMARGLQTKRTNTIALLDLTQTTVPVTPPSWDSDTKFNSAVLDLAKTMYQATSYLIRQGHSKIAYVNDRAGSRISFQKKGGYLKAMADAGFPVPDGYVYSGNYSCRTGHQAAKQFMQCPDSPTAIVAANDIIAIGCCKYLHLNDYRIPQDVSAVGMDGIQLAKIYAPSITTMATSISTMGSKAVSLLINKIDHLTSQNRQTLFESKLTIDRSTDENAPLYLEF